MKTCFKCLINKPYSDFYKHAQMGDGHLNKCKQCTKNDVNKHRADNIERVREYDRGRGYRPYLEYQKSDACKKSMNESRKRWELRNKEKKKAHGVIGNAVRYGKMQKQPCFCGEQKSEFHHPDYSKPLEGVWVCDKHHKEIHKKEREEKRKLKAQATSVV